MKTIITGFVFLVLSASAWAGSGIVVPVGNEAVLGGDVALTIFYQLPKNSEAKVIGDGSNGIAPGFVKISRQKAGTSCGILFVKDEASLPLSATCSLKAGNEKIYLAY